MKLFKLASLFTITALYATTGFAEVIMKDDSTTSFDTWTGYYGGVNIGAVQHTLEMTDNQAVTFLSTIQQVTNPSLTGGLQAGYRRQMDVSNVSGVYGIEFSANISNASFSKTFGSPFAVYQLSAKNQLNNLYLLQLVGGVAAGKTLVFATAGLSLANISGNVTNQSSVPFFNSFSLDQNAVGPAIGFGIEYAINRKISARFKVDAIRPNAYTTNDDVGNSYQISNTIVQGTFGVNYKFS